MFCLVTRFIGIMAYLKATDTIVFVTYLHEFKILVENMINDGRLSIISEQLINFMKQCTHMDEYRPVASRRFNTHPYYPPTVLLKFTICIQNIMNMFENMRVVKEFADHSALLEEMTRNLHDFRDISSVADDAEFNERYPNNKEYDRRRYICIENSLPMMFVITGHTDEEVFVNSDELIIVLSLIIEN